MYFIGYIKLYSNCIRILMGFYVHHGLQDISKYHYMYIYIYILGTNNGGAPNNVNVAVFFFQLSIRGEMF